MQDEPSSTSCGHINPLSVRLPSKGHAKTISLASSCPPAVGFIDGQCAQQRIERYFWHPKRTLFIWAEESPPGEFYNASQVSKQEICRHTSKILPKQSSGTNVFEWRWRWTVPTVVQLRMEIRVRKEPACEGTSGPDPIHNLQKKTTTAFWLLWLSLGEFHTSSYANWHKVYDLKKERHGTKKAKTNQKHETQNTKHKQKLSGPSLAARTLQSFVPNASFMPRTTSLLAFLQKFEYVTNLRLLFVFHIYLQLYSLANSN